MKCWEFLSHCSFAWTDRALVSRVRPPAFFAKIKHGTTEVCNILQVNKNYVDEKSMTAY